MKLLNSSVIRISIASILTGISSGLVGGAFRYCLIVLGMVRDWVVDKRVHKVYLYALPSLIVMQSLAIYAWRINPKGWQGITQAILGW
jgi:hypothetical protein